LSNLSINPAAALGATGLSNKSPAPADTAAPTFSRRAPAENTVMDAKSRPRGPYVDDPYPNEPKLVGGTLVNGRILNSSYAHEGLVHDLMRLVNDLSHGKTQKARERMELMSMVDIGDHLKNFKIDPQLFAKLSAVTNDTKLTPQQMHRAVADVLQKTGAARFVINSPTSKTAA
jgi:hypothetical protein